MSDTAKQLLFRWTRRQLASPELAWLEERIESLRQDGADRGLHIALGMAPRKLGKADLDLSAADLAAADQARPGWDPRFWSIDQAARIVLLMAADGPGHDFRARFIDLARTADPSEQVAYYRGLPLYPDPKGLEEQAAEGVRSNIRAVFEAVAHRSPYPREQFAQHRWNHMVLKALFVGSTLAPIQGLDDFANEELALILCDYAHERWAANRPVTPELWRCVGPFATGNALDDLARVIEAGDEDEQKAAGLALAASPDAGAKSLLAKIPAIASMIEAGGLTWKTLTPDA